MSCRLPNVRGDRAGSRAQHGRLDTSDNRALAVRRRETRLIVVDTPRMPLGVDLVRLARGVRTEKRHRLPA